MTRGQNSLEIEFDRPAVALTSAARGRRCVLAATAEELAEHERVLDEVRPAGPLPGGSRGPGTRMTLQLDPERRSRAAAWSRPCPGSFWPAGILLSLGLWYDAHVTRAPRRVSNSTSCSTRWHAASNRASSRTCRSAGSRGCSNSSDSVTRQGSPALSPRSTSRRAVSRHPGPAICRARRAPGRACYRDSSRRLPDYRMRPSGERETLHVHHLPRNRSTGANQRAFWLHVCRAGKAEGDGARAQHRPGRHSPARLPWSRKRTRTQAGVLFTCRYSHAGPGSRDDARKSSGLGLFALRMKDIMQNLLKREHPEIAGRVAIAIYDGEAVADGALLFESEPLPVRIRCGRRAASNWPGSQDRRRERARFRPAGGGGGGNARFVAEPASRCSSPYW